MSSYFTTRGPKGPKATTAQGGGTVRDKPPYIRALEKRRVVAFTAMPCKPHQAWWLIDGRTNPKGPVEIFR